MEDDQELNEAEDMIIQLRQNCQTQTERADKAEAALLSAEEEHDKELGRWQGAIYRLIKEETGADVEIDGSGCDSGDPLDLTLAEISQGFAYLDDKCFELLRGLGLLDKAEISKLVEESKSSLSVVLDLFAKHLLKLTIAEGKIGFMGAAPRFGKRKFTAWDDEGCCQIPSEQVAVTGEGEVLTYEEREDRWMREIVPVTLSWSQTSLAEASKPQVNRM